jgi:hypothetical protein
MTVIEKYTVQLFDGRIGYVDSIQYSPYYGDTSLYAYVIALDGSWADYVAI